MRELSVGRASGTSRATCRSCGGASGWGTSPGPGRRRGAVPGRGGALPPGRLRDQPDGGGVGDGDARRCGSPQTPRGAPVGRRARGHPAADGGCARRRGCSGRAAAGVRWEWMWTDAEPEPVPGEDRVVELDACSAGVRSELAAFLAVNSPRHSAEPDDEHARCWLGIRARTASCSRASRSTRRPAGVDPGRPVGRGRRGRPRAGPRAGHAPAAGTRRMLHEGGAGGDRGPVLRQRRCPGPVPPPRLPARPGVRELPVARRPDADLADAESGTAACS